MKKNLVLIPFIQKLHCKPIIIVILCKFKFLSKKDSVRMRKIKYELEYIVNTSPNILFTCITTPSGLSEWFADDVNIKDDRFTFFWDGDEEVAKLMQQKKGDSIRFQWEDDEGEDYYFELLINIDPLTKEVALLVTDFAEEGELEGAKLLWDNMAAKLKQVIGG